MMETAEKARCACQLMFVMPDGNLRLKNIGTKSSNALPGIDCLCYRLFENMLLIVSIMLFVCSTGNGLRLFGGRTCSIFATAKTQKLTSMSMTTSGLSTAAGNSKKFPRRLPVAFDKKTPELQKEEEERVKRCIQFLDASPEPFHVVSTAESMLQAAGFKPLKEDSLWRKTGAIKRGGKYYFTRNGSSMLAFVVGSKWNEDQSAFKIIGAHTDSPNLKLKPRSKRSGSGVIQLNVECYGGGLWHTWFDRDLSLAGRVILRQPDDTFAHRLVRINRPVLRVPNLCIHLRSADEREVFKVNKEDHMIPILCDHVEKTMSSSSSSSSSSASTNTSNDTTDSGTEPTQEGEKGDVTMEKKNKGNDEEKPEVDQWASEQQPELLTLLAKELGTASSILCSA